MNAGSTYFIVTRTFFWVGRVARADERVVVLEPGASNVFRTGDGSHFRGGGEPLECETVPVETRLNRANVVSVEDWPHAIPADRPAGRAK